MIEADYQQWRIVTDKLAALEDRAHRLANAPDLYQDTLEQQAMLIQVRERHDALLRKKYEIEERAR